MNKVEKIISAADQKGREKLIEAEARLQELQFKISETKDAAKQLIGRLGDLMKLGI